MARKPLAKMGKWVPEIQKALDQAMSDHLQVTQGKLVRYNPKDTGRMASSWVISHDRIDYRTRSPDWGQPGQKLTEQWIYPAPITADGSWYISNSVPYSYKICYDPRAAGGDGEAESGNWFTSIETQQASDLDRQIMRQLRKVKL